MASHGAAGGKRLEQGEPHAEFFCGGLLRLNRVPARGQGDVVSWDEVLDVQVILSCSCWSLLHCAMMYPPDAS